MMLLKGYMKNEEEELWERLKDNDEYVGEVNEETINSILMDLLMFCHKDFQRCTLM